MARRRRKYRRIRRRGPMARTARIGSNVYTSQSAIRAISKGYVKGSWW